MEKHLRRSAPRRARPATVTTGRLAAALLAAIVATFVPRGPARADATALRVGIAADYPPIAFRRDGAPAGLEVDLAHQMGEELGKEIRFRTYPFPRLIPALLAKEIDVIMSGMSVTAERAKKVAFVEPYLRVGQMALIRAADLSRFVPSSELLSTSARVGFVERTTGEALVREKFANAKPKGYPGAPEGVAALRRGEIDVFVHDAPTIWRVSLDPKERELLALYEPLTEEYLAWAVRPDDTELKAALDGVVRRWKQGSWLDATINHWIPVRVEIKPRMRQ